MTSESDSWADMDDSFSFQSQPMISPSTRTTSKATAWTVDLANSAETLPLYPQASISSVRLAARLKRKHLSSNIRKNNYPAEQYTPPKTTAHYTISQDCTAGFEVRKRQLLADFGKKSRGRKNYFGHLGNMRLEPDVIHRRTHAGPGQQMKQMQNQAGMAGNIQPSQSPAMNTLNTPISRPANDISQGPGQGNVQFGDQRFNQGAQRPNNQMLQNMLASLPQEQRAIVSGLTPDKLNEVMQRWQTKRQEQMGLNGGQVTPGQMPNRPPSQMGQMNANMGGQMPVGMQQSQNGVPMNGNPQQMQMPRIPPNQQMAMMDSMDLPPQVLNQLQNQLPPDIKKWGYLKGWLLQNNIPGQLRTQLSAIQKKQFQLTFQRRASMMPQ